MATSAMHDLWTFLEGAKIAAIFLDHDRKLTRFTDSIGDIYPIRQSDIGRPLTDILGSDSAHELPLPDDTELPDGSDPIEEEIETAARCWYRRRVWRHPDANGRPGLVATYVDISDFKRVESRLATEQAVTQMLANAASFNEVEHQVLDRICQCLRASVGMLWLPDDNNVLRCVSSMATSNSSALTRFIQHSKELQFSVGEGLPGLVWNAATTEWIPDVRQHSWFARADLASQCGLVSGIATPIISGKKCRGVLEFFTEQAMDPDPPTANMLNSIGSEIALFVRRYQAAETLRDQEARQSAILACALDCIITMDVNGDIVDFNPAAESTFGHSAAEVVGQSLAETIIPEEYRKAHRLGLARYLETGKSDILGKRIELTARRSTGELFPIELAIHTTFARDGKPFFTAYLRDITERNRANRTLAQRAQLAKLHSDLAVALSGAQSREMTLQQCCELLVEHIDAAFARIWLLNETDDNLQLVASAGMYTHTDGTHGSVPVGEFKIGQIAASRQPLMTSDVANDPNISDHTWAQREGMVSFAGFPLLIEDQLLGVVALFARHELAVEVFEEMRPMADAIAQCVRRKDVEAREKRQAENEHFLSEAGAALVSSLGYEETLAKVTRLCVPALADWAFLDLVDSEQQTRRVAVAHASEDHAELAKRVAQFPARPQWPDHPPWRGLFGGQGYLVADFTPEMIERSAQNEDHARTIRDVGPRSLVVVPLRARGVTFGALTMIVSDSGRRYGLGDLQVAEEFARRASLAIDNALLYESAQQANRAKSEFLANMSHEIRTPMTSVLGYTDLLASREDDPEKSEFLDIIRRNGNFLLDIINDILDLSRIEAGKLEIVREQVMPYELVSEVHSLMQLRAQEQELDFIIEFDGKIPRYIECDPKCLRQILINLIGNAIKFTKQGSVRLITRYLADDPAPKLQFDIVDTGIGIEPHQLSALFRPFSQGDASVTRNFGGTGLGLTISRRLANMLGGDITVESQPGKGSKFSITVDIGKVAEIEWINPVFSAKETRDTAVVNNYRFDAHILVVDDRRDVRYLANHLLGKAGATVDMAEDGIEAVDKVKRAIAGETSYDLVLLDMQMPRLDGYSAVAQIRELGFEQPVIAMTADAMEEDRNQCLQRGCDAYLRKPIDANELLQLVAQLRSGLDLAALKAQRRSRQSPGADK